MVGSVDELHDLVLSSTVIEHVHLGHVAVDQAIGDLCQRVVERIERCGLDGRATVKVLALMLSEREMRLPQLLARSAL